MNFRKMGHWVLVASTLLVLSGCEQMEEEEDDDDRDSLTITPSAPRVVGPWVTCEQPPLCNEYLTRNLQAWDRIYHSCERSSDGRQCPSDYDMPCAIEYDGGDIEERRVFGDSDRIPSVEFARLCNDLGGR